MNRQVVLINEAVYTCGLACSGAALFGRIVMALVVFVFVSKKRPQQLGPSAIGHRCQCQRRVTVISI